MHLVTLTGHFVLVTFTYVILLSGHNILWWRYYSRFTDEETEVEGVKIGYEKYTVEVREVAETGYKDRWTCVLQAGSHKLR